MKKFFALTLLSLSFLSQAADLELAHFNWRINDIADKGLTKEKLFSELDRDFIKLGQSICANRALLWLHQLKKDHDVDGSKIFLFYTNKTGKVGSKRWWYHVAPIVNEGGTEYVLDGGFSSKIDSPLKVEGWLNEFVGSNKCYEITPSDRDLVELMNEGSMFPRETHRGTYDCYFIKAPAGYWFPGTVAMNLLGTGTSSEEIDKKHVYEACKEAVTSPIGRFLGSGKKKCRKLAGL